MPNISEGELRRVAGEDTEPDRCVKQQALRNHTHSTLTPDKGIYLQALCHPTHGSLTQLKVFS